MDLQAKVRQLMDGQSQADFAAKLGVSQPTVGRFLLDGLMGLKLARALGDYCEEIKDEAAGYYLVNGRSVGRKSEEELSTLTTHFSSITTSTLTTARVA